MSAGAAGAAPFVILGRPDRHDWQLLLCVAGGGVLATIDPDDADALASELVRMAELARRPGSLPG